MKKYIKVLEDNKKKYKNQWSVLNQSGVLSHDAQISLHVIV